MKRTLSTFGGGLYGILPGGLAANLIGVVFSHLLHKPEWGDSGFAPLEFVIFGMVLGAVVGAVVCLREAVQEELNSDELLRPSSVLEKAFGLLRPSRRNHAMNGTAIGRRRREAPFRGAEKQSV